MNPKWEPTNPTDLLRGSDKVTLLFGIDMVASEGKLQGKGLVIEVGFPIYQYFDDHQLQVDNQLTLVLVC